MAEGAGVKILPERPRRRTRRLSEEEIALWAEVARTRAAPRAAPRRRSEPPPPPRRRQPPPPPPARAGAPRRAAGPPPLAPLERKLKRDLARGRGGVDAALDLHGLNQAEAHHALRGFLVARPGARRPAGDRRHRQGRARTPRSWIDEPGVLRRLAPHWLRAPDMRGIVLGFEEAGRAHGGAGALYVRLRRGR